MSFIWPTMLIFLILVPLGVWMYLRLQQQRRRLLATYGSLGFVQGTARRPLGVRRHVPPAFFLLGLTLLVVSLARPQAVVSLPRVEGTVILAFDISGSMAAEDMKPTRMEAAKAAARAFVQRQPRTIQIGVVGFSDSGFTTQAPTNDQDTILGAINRLAPQKGTSVGQGILASLKAIAVEKGEVPATKMYSNLTPTPAPSPTSMPKGTYTSAVIVLLTDGENNEAPDPLAVAQATIDRGIRIYTVGIGSPAGITLKVNGFTVHTQLDEGLLKQIADMTDGVYYKAENQDELRKIYDNLNLQFVVKPEKMEITSLFAGVSTLMLLMGGMFSLAWFSRVP